MPAFACRCWWAARRSRTASRARAARAATMLDHTYAEAPAPLQAAEETPVRVTEARSHKVRAGLAIPAAPYLDRKLRDVPHLAEIWSYINPHMLYGKHLGY